jgi:hypothetical protein
VVAKPEPASLSVTKSWALVEMSCQYRTCRWKLADILKYLINRSVELRESHVLLLSFRGSSLGCVEARTGSIILSDASLSVSTASARMCKGDTSELPESPFERLCSIRWSSGLVIVYATDTSLVWGVWFAEPCSLCVSETEPEGCKFRDEARIAAITCSPTALS